MIKFKLLLPMAILFLLAPSRLSATEPGQEYIGAEACKKCHIETYDKWKASGHAQILQKSSNAELIDIPFPEGYNSESVSYVIGGYRWKALFLDEEGYLITSIATGSGRNQYNVKSRTWVDYLPGQKVPYDCGGCHTTGYSPEDHQDGLIGITGAWEFDGVQCEACHGPGALHATTSRKEDIGTGRNACIKCHGAGVLDVIPLEGVFLAPYTEANQLLKSAMKDMSCVDCHDPHSSSEKSTKKTCKQCHQKIAIKYDQSYMHKLGVACTDCHMPPAGVVAEGNTGTFEGDLRSHIFKVDHHKEFPLQVINGQRTNPGYLSVDYSCMWCHSLYETREWAVSFGASSHKIKITTNIKIMRLQMVLAFVGLVFAMVALMSAFSLKGWLWPAEKKRKMLSVHKHAAWITFGAYVIISIICIYFHFPLEEPSKALELGWFVMHIFNGALGLIIYGGKILTVRKFKKGWTHQGTFWGFVIFAFWLIQSSTALLSHFNVGKV
jgi:hypothetical protein